MLPPEPGAPALGVKAWVTESAARDLARRGGKDLDALRTAASLRRFKAVPLGLRAAATLQQRSARKTAANVVAKLPGTNDRQGVVLTAHWDHFGIRDPQPGEPKDADRIFNGAYDNASGCAGLLEIAKAMARAPQKPGRSIYFVFTTGEEAGLLGSEYFTAHPPIPSAAMAANLNVDGVNYLGPTKDMVQLGADRSTLGPMVEEILKDRGRTLGKDAHPERGYFFRSDHFPLAKAGVPALSLNEPKEFTGPNAAALLEKQENYNGKDYHQPSDEYDPSWDFSGGVEDLKVIAQLAWRVAAAEALPTYNEGDQFANPRK
jgi:Zn-dependent M28 family amino/carboxypeptidase